MSRLIAASLLCTLLVTSGCGGSGPKLFPVTGVVKVDGAAKSKLMVTFTPIAGGIGAVGTTNENGEYTLQTNGKRGAIEGQHKVAITTIQEPEEAPKANPTGPSGGDAYMNQARVNPQEFKKRKETIPSKYNTSSELVRMVDSQGTKFDFDISTKEK